MRCMKFSGAKRTRTSSTRGSARTNSCRGAAGTAAADAEPTSTTNKKQVSQLAYAAAGRLAGAVGHRG